MLSMIGTGGSKAAFPGDRFCHDATVSRAREKTITPWQDVRDRPHARAFSRGPSPEEGRGVCLQWLGCSSSIHAQNVGERARRLAGSRESAGYLRLPLSWRRLAQSWTGL